MTNRFAQSPAIISCHQNNRMLTYDQLNQRVLKLAKGFIGLGLNPGDRVGIYSPNCIEWTITQLAASRSGLILVNINPAYMKNELQYALNKVQCKVIVMAREDAKSNYLGILESIDENFQHKNDRHDLKLSQLPHLKKVVLLPKDATQSNQSDDLVKNFQQYFRYQQLQSIGESESKFSKELDQRNQKMQFDQPTNIQFTSGTTGFPKGATLSHHNILNNGYMIGERLNYTQKDKICVPVPLYHCFGMVIGNICAFSHGSSVVFPSPTFRPVPTLEAIDKYSCTSLYGVPTMFVSILSAKQKGNYNTSSLRTGVMAGSICPQPLMRRVVDQLNMNEVTVCYGATETSPVSFQSRVDSSIQKRVSTIGELHPHIEAKVIDQKTGKIVQIGERGQLCIRGYSVMLKYWGDEEATKKSIDSDGWYHSGDIATIDQDDYGNIYGRYGDMIIRGGENVYPKEIEELIATHPDIQDVQVIGVKDYYYGEQICAWVSLRDGVKERIKSQSGGEDLQKAARKLILNDFCAGKISKFKIPKFLRVVDSFPMTVTGKIKKNVMRDIENQRISNQKVNI